MALRRPPPSTEQSDSSGRVFRKRKSSLLALARWQTIWMPECPPLSLGLGVEVQQDVALQQSRLQAEGAVHAGLLRGGEERLQRTVHERVVLEHGEDRRHADAVVGPERRAVGRHPLAVDVGVDRVLLEVEDLVVVLLRHHVEVCLQDHALAALHALRGRFAHVDVVRLVLTALQPFRAGEVEDVAADLLLMVRGARDAHDFGKMFPDKRRFERR